MSSSMKSSEMKESYASKTELSDCTSFKREEFTYVWSIEKFADFFDRKYELPSPIFTPDAHCSAKWRLVLFQEVCYPKGISVAIALAKMSKESIRHGVKYSVLIVDKNGKHVPVQTREKVFRNCSDADEFVLISLAELREQSLLQSNGTLIIRCEMDVLFAESDDKPEVKLLTPPITHTVANIDLNNFSTKSSIDKVKNVNINEFRNDYIPELNISNIDQKLKNFLSEPPPKVQTGDSSLKYLSDHFKSLYMTKSFYDIMVCVDGMEMRCHKAILSARSEYFRKACESAVNNKVVVSGVKGATLEAILYYLYTGQMRYLTPEFAKDLLPVSKKFSIPHLEKLAVEFLKNHLNANNVADIIQLSEQLKIEDLRFSAIKFLSSLKQK